MLRGLLGIAAFPFIVTGRPASANSSTGFFDMHAHPVVNLRAAAMPPAARLIGAMDAHGIERTVLSPPPATRDEGSGGTYGAAELGQLVA